MLFEVTFWIAFISASRTIAKIYYRRRDVLYGPYCATIRARRSRTADWSGQTIKQWDSTNGRQRLEPMRATVRPDTSSDRVQRRARG
jgi:hypothetical protein